MKAIVLIMTIACIVVNSCTQVSKEDTTNNLKYEPLTGAIGYKDKEQYVLNGSLERTKVEWLKILQQSKIEERPDTQYISVQTDRGNNEPYYLLYATNRESTIKMGRELVMVNDSLYFVHPTDSTRHPYSGLITCRGSVEGCYPEKFNGEWQCYYGSDTNCVKSVTILF